VLSFSGFNQFRNGAAATTAGGIFISDARDRLRLAQRKADTSSGTIPTAAWTCWDQEVNALQSRIG
jgi:hypothetical protein